MDAYECRLVVDGVATAYLGGISTPKGSEVVGLYGSNNGGLASILNSE